MIKSGPIWSLLLFSFQPTGIIYFYTTNTSTNALIRCHLLPYLSTSFPTPPLSFPLPPVTDPPISEMNTPPSHNWYYIYYMTICTLWNWVVRSSTLFKGLCARMWVQTCFVLLPSKDTSVSQQLTDITETMNNVWTWLETSWKHLFRSPQINHMPRLVLTTLVAAYSSRNPNWCFKPSLVHQLLFI